MGKAKKAAKARAAKIKKPPRLVCGIDPGASSGFASFVDGAFFSSASVKTADQRGDFLSYALCKIWEDTSSVVVYIETWNGRVSGNRSLKSWIGTGAARGRWEETLELAGIRKSQIKMVTPQQWRKVYGGKQVRKSEDWKAAAVEKYTADNGKKPGSADEAEAYVIALYGVAKEAGLIA